MSVSGSRLGGVTHISLWSDISDHDLMELARADSGLKSLRLVSLYGTKVTKAGIIAMQKARPEVVVSR